MTSLRFPCTPGGAVARGRRRLAALLGGLALLTLAVAAGTLACGRVGAGVIALLVALGPLLAWILAAGSAVEELALDGSRLTLQLRRGPEQVPLAGAAARRLTPEEVAHLERLASSAGVVTGVGSFDSGRLGELDLYASDLAHAVLVETGDRRLVVTPDDPEAFCGLVAAAAAATIAPP